MNVRVEARKVALEKVRQTHGEDSTKYAIAKADLDYATKDYQATKEGIDELKLRADRFKNEYTQRDYIRAKQTREMQVNALKEIKNGRVEAMSVLQADPTGFYSRAEVEGVIWSSREYYERWDLKDNPGEVAQQTQEAYDTDLTKIEARLRAANNGNLTPEQTAAINHLRTLTPPDSVNARAYSYIPFALDRSKKALKAEITRIGNIQGVPFNIAAAYYEAYREQYNTQYANLESKFRPDPPDSWVYAESPWGGYTKDFNTAFAPRDPASLYANYRLRCDEDAIPDFLKSSRNYASVDIETAGPAGKEGFKPENGRIIEVGIVTYNPKGKEIGRYSQLIRPEQTFLDIHGTGAEHIHKISVADLGGKPDWESVKKRVASKLEGSVIVGQNVEGFEVPWFNHHLGGNALATVDTLDIARKHFDLPNYKLETVCGALGVSYTNGHRALHDAEAAGELLFAAQKAIKKTWNSHTARKNAAALTGMPMQSRWDHYTAPAPRAARSRTW